MPCLARGLLVLPLALSLTSCAGDGAAEDRAPDAGRSGDGGGPATGGQPPDAGTGTGAGGADASAVSADAAASGGDPGGDVDAAGTAPDASAALDAGPDATRPDDAAPPAVTVRFRAKVGDADFRCGQSYPGVGSTRVTVQPLDLRFYVQQLWLVTAGGDEVPVALATRPPWQTPDVALLDFEERRGLCFSGDAATNAIVTGDVPDGDYTGIAFTVGVPATLNHADPSTYPPPLRSPGMPWSWLMGFRFLKAELQGPTATFGLGYAHPGSTSCSGTPATGTVRCARPNRNKVRLDGFDAATQVVVVDVAKIFEGSDLSVDTECHGAGATCEPMYDALGIDLGTGLPSPSQTAFRVE